MAEQPVLHAPRPALRIGNFEAAIDHYVAWLGFNLDWEWREAPGQPAIGFLSRDHFAFMINEYPDAPGPAAIHLEVENLDALVAEWNRKRPGSASVRNSPPYEFPEVIIEDPWGNRLIFEGKDEAQEKARRDQVRIRMRDYVRTELEAGRALPTPEALRDAVGPPLGVAIEVLNEHPEYARAFSARQTEADDGNAP